MAALTRATEAVAALPPAAAAGVTMSIGVACAPLGGEPTAALAVADAAMYRAKRAGGNAVVSGTVGEVHPRPTPSPHQALPRPPRPLPTSPPATPTTRSHGTRRAANGAAVRD